MTYIVRDDMRDLEREAEEIEVPFDEDVDSTARGRFRKPADDADSAFDDGEQGRARRSVRQHVRLLRARRRRAGRR
jgi:hypothetical protein